MDKPSDQAETDDRRNIPKVNAIFSELAEHAVSSAQHGFIRAAESGRSRLHERQLHKDLDHFWVRLGKTAFHLLEAGEIDHPALDKASKRIKVLEKELSEIRRRAQ